MASKDDQPQAQAEPQLHPQPAEDYSRNADDGEMAKRVLRKIDYYIIPVLFITYMLNFMDKTILSSASVFGLRDDTVSLVHDE
jgi:hypothetical protein